MHVLYFWTSLLAVLAFAPAMLGPGYLLAYGLDLGGFRRRMRWPEQAMWSVALSAAVAILIAVYGGLVLGNVRVGVVFALCGVAAAVLQWTTAREGMPSGWLRQRPVKTVWIAVTAICAFLLLAAAGVEVRGRLMEGVAAGDWSVRVPLIGSAIRTGMPLVNPFYAVGGQVGPLRYYMYWYALCGAVGRTWHLPARAVMEGSTVWAAVLLLSVLFLLLRTMFVPAKEWPPMRWAAVCVGGLCAIPVLGLDVLEALYARALPRQVMPEIEWWRAAAGFSPSFHTFLLYAPHHAFGMAAGLTGMLVLLLPRLRASAELGCGPKRTVLLGAVAGLCFGALSGTSTYVAVFFGLACVLVAVDFAARRDWWMVLSVAVSGVVGAAGALHIVHLILNNPATGAGGAFVALHVRAWWPLVDWYLGELAKRGLAVPSLTVQWAELSVLYLLLELAEAGVFVFVLVHRARRDLFSGERLSTEGRMQWILFAAFALCALFLTSAGTIGTNDLGFHAGFALRVVAVLWSAPWAATLLASREQRTAVWRSGWGKVAVAFAALGVMTQVWQVVGQRFILVAPATFHRVAGPFPDPPDLPHQYEQAYQAWEAIGRMLPADARVLTNADSAQRSLGLLYANRQMVAPEPGCMTAFGGDPKACRAALPEIRLAFGSARYGAAEPVWWTGADLASFERVCGAQRATAVLVTADDAVWKQPASWVWRLRPVYANERERVYLCGGAGV